MDTSKEFLQSILTRFGGIHTESSAIQKSEILSTDKSFPSSYSFPDVIQENTKKPQQCQLATHLSLYVPLAMVPMSFSLFQSTGIYWF